MNIIVHSLGAMLTQPGRLTLKYIMVDPKGMPDFSKSHKLWTKPAGNLSIYYKNVSFDPTDDLDICVKSS